MLGDVHTCIYLSIWKSEKTSKNPEIRLKTHFLLFCSLVVYLKYQTPPSMTMSLEVMSRGLPETALEDSDFLSHLGDLFEVKTSKNQDFKCKKSKIKKVLKMITFTDVDDSYLNRHGNEKLITLDTIINLKDSNSIRKNANRSKTEEQCPISSVKYTSETRSVCPCNDSKLYANHELCTKNRLTNIGSFCGEWSGSWEWSQIHPRTVLVHNVANKIEMKTTTKLPLFEMQNGQPVFINEYILTVRTGHGKSMYDTELRYSQTVSKKQYDLGKRHSFCDNKQCWGNCKNTVGRCLPRLGFTLVNGGWAMFRQTESNLEQLAKAKVAWSNMPMIGGQN